MTTIRRRVDVLEAIAKALPDPNEPTTDEIRAEIRARLQAIDDRLTPEERLAMEKYAGNTYADTRRILDALYSRMDGMPVSWATNENNLIQGER